MTKFELDTLNPVYSKLNMDLISRLVDDYVTYQEYVSFLLPKITSLNVLYNKRITINALWSDTIKCKNDIRRNTVAIRETEKEIIEFCLNLENGYYYILAPHYTYCEREECYKQVLHSGSTPVNISLAVLLLKTKLSL